MIKFAKATGPFKKSGVRAHVSLHGRAINLALPLVFLYFASLHASKPKKTSSWFPYRGLTGDVIQTPWGMVSVAYLQLNYFPKI